MENKVKISTQNLNLYYGENHALKNINLDLYENKITAFIGPSGCGKSTYLKTLNRMNDLVPNVKIDGTVLLDGEDIYDVKGVDRLLLDKYTDKEYGGSGRTFDWHGGSRIKTDKPIVLAGGIKTENVIEGINIFKPVGVDISSSVETGGFKDEQKIKKFIETVRSYENE